MLNDFIGGGQIFLHKIAMFMQVLGRSIKVSLILGMLIGGLINCTKLVRMDQDVFVLMIKAHVVQSFDDIIASIKHEKKESQILVKHGQMQGKIAISKVLSNQNLKNVFNAQILLLKQTLLYMTYGSFTIFVLIFVIWDRFGGKMKSKTHIKGHVVQSASQVYRYLKWSKKASDIVIGGVPLVKNSETRHILITGSTGSGKTNCLHEILPQIRENKQAAVVVDTEGDMIARYYRPGYDIIINPFDARSHSYDLFAEIKSQSDIKKIATSFFPDSPADSHELDKKWTSWGKILFIGILEYLIESKTASISNLYEMIHKISVDELVKKLQNTSAANILSKNESNVAAHNIRINTILATEWLEFTAKSDKKFCFKDWFSNVDDRWIFLASFGSNTKILTPMLSTLSDIAINSLIDLGPKESRKVWFIFDELAKLKYLPSLCENITLLRKYGGCILAATQSFNQIFSYYGKNTGSVMLGQFGTNVIFRITQVDEATIIAKRIGEIEYMMHQKNISYGAHEMRDGISYNEIEKTKHLVSPHDLANLDVFECFMLLPDPAVAIVRTKLKFCPKPTELQPAFCEGKIEPLKIKETEDILGIVETAMKKVDV